MDTGAQMEFVPSGLKGEVARFDLTTRTAPFVVEKDKRITGPPRAPARADRHRLRQRAEDYLVGRVVARNMVDADTGEIVAKANDEVTEALLKKAAPPPASRTFSACTQRAEPGRLHQPDAGDRRDR